MYELSSLGRLKCNALLINFFTWCLIIKKQKHDCPTKSARAIEDQLQKKKSESPMFM